jgi:hypothetical protein
MPMRGDLPWEAVSASGSKPVVATKSIALSIDGGHVRAARQYQGRTFEVLLAQVSNDEGKQVVFASVWAEATSQTRQLRGVLHGLGATQATPITILSDGADGPRSLGEAASPGPTHHVLDWFHLAMRVQHVAQAATSWPDATESNRQAGVCVAGTIERIRWRLWHGQVRCALDLIAETLVLVDAMDDDMPTIAAAARKVARLLGELETYVSGQSDIIIDYATARRREEPISTAITESTVDGDLAKLADGRLSPLAVIGDIGEHEDLASGRCDFQQEAGYRRVAKFVGRRLFLRRVDDGLRELEFRHS